MIHGYKIIAFCTVRAHTDESRRLLERMNQLLPPKGYRIFVYNAYYGVNAKQSGDTGQSRIYDMIPFDKIDALVVFEEKIFNDTVSDRIVEMAKAAGVPVISVGKAYEGCANVEFDYDASFDTIVEHVLGHHGVRKLHLMAGMRNNPFSDIRIAATRRVMEKYGLTLQEEDISYGDFWAWPTRVAMEALLERKDLPEAVICVNDAMAITVCQVLQERGYSVPEDMIVTGFDGIDDIYYNELGITSGACQYERIAEEVCEILEDGVPKHMGKSRKLLADLILQESCGCGKCERRNAFEMLNFALTRVDFLLNQHYHFTELSSAVQYCETMDEVAALMQEVEDRMFHEVTCLINKSFTGEVKELVTEMEGNGLDDTMCVLYQEPTKLYPFKTFDMDTADVVPNLEELLEPKRPLIFSSLSFRGTPIGYVCFSYDEVNMENYLRMPQIINALNEALGGMRNMRYQHLLTQRLEEMYSRDMLTGIYNRHGFSKAYEDAKERLKGGHTHLSIVFLDADGLKRVNDIYGHKEGDNVIRTVAKAIEYAVAPDGICMRFGGDEFIGVASATLDDEVIKKRVETFLDTYNSLSEKPYKVSASVGVSIEPISENLDFDKMMRRADELMYFEKRRKKGLPVAE